MSADAAPASPADNPPERRTCTKCSAEKVVSPETWPYRKGRRGIYQAHGGRCLECEKKRKAEYEERRDSIAKQLLDTPAPEKGKAGAKRASLHEASKLDVAKALKAGSLSLNAVAPAVMARVLEYLEDPDHEHHLWALELLAQRILPRKLYEELGGQAAGVGALQDKRPMFVVNVLPAGNGQPGETYEHEVPALAAPPDEPEVEEVPAAPVVEEVAPDPFT